jgi:hypothetical protein
MAGAADEKKPQIEIASDEDWKNRVKAEDARLDAEQRQHASTAGRSSDPPAAEGSQTGEDTADVPLESVAESEQVPPASFATLLQLLSTQAIVCLGVIPAPDGSNAANLPVARHFIDLIGMLEEKTRGNLSSVESRLLEQTLHELRMTFIEASRGGK